jgi:hypothetical protein
MTSTDPHLLAGRDAEVPISNGLQRQGDVLVLPLREQEQEEGPPRFQPAAAIPAEGVMVVSGEAGGNGHLLLGDGTWAPAWGRRRHLGVVHVATEAYLLHPEHAALGLAAGDYLLRRQREQTADGPAAIAD